jgi:formate hydrogenlyase subunit 4
MLVLDIFIHLILLILFPPFLIGFINKVKAWTAGKQGPSLFQVYYDIEKLLKKGAVYSSTATWIFKAGPILTSASLVCAGLILPMMRNHSTFGFTGDLIFFVYLFALGHFFLLISALDVGSSFEGMGASRGAAFGTFAELALFSALAIFCIPAGSPTFKSVFTALPWKTWGFAHPAYLAGALVLLAVLLTENSRLPIDDPNTHLELTMIHEVMVLDHGGPDFAFILYSSSLKLLLQADLLIHFLLPFPSHLTEEGVLLLLSGILGIGILIGILESVTARLRLQRIPQFLIGAFILTVLGLMISFYRGAP